jgi:hypothetical protein
VTDEIWAEAAEHFDEPRLSALVSMVALTNFFNRVKPPSGSSPAPGISRRLLGGARASTLMTARGS